MEKVDFTSFIHRTHDNANLIIMWGSDTVYKGVASGIAKNNIELPNAIFKQDIESIDLIEEQGKAYIMLYFRYEG